MDSWVVRGADTNMVFSSMVDSATSQREALDKQLDDLREENLRRDFEAFVKAGKKLPVFKPRDPNGGLRYSTTTESALASTASRYDECVDRGELKKQRDERKMKNWTPQYELGNDKIQYGTVARGYVANEQNSPANKLKNQARTDAANTEARAATKDARDRCKNTMEGYSKTQWQLGEFRDSIKNAVQTSVLPNPTGENFHSYRGVLDPNIGKTLRTSTAFLGTLDPSIKPDYNTNTMLGYAATNNSGSQANYKEVKAKARSLKNSLQSSKISFGDEQRKLTTDYRDGYKWNDEKAKSARVILDPELVQKLRKTTMYTGDPDHKPEYVTEKQYNNAKFLKDAKTEKRDITKDYELQRKLKLRLSRNTFQIGNDQRYMY
jgi:hypothetical protein